MVGCALTYIHLYLHLYVYPAVICAVEPVPVCVQANLFKTERDKLTRALVKEVGDETPLSKLMEAGSDWRGRAQQISLLKAKVADLQQAQVLLLHVLLLDASHSRLARLCKAVYQALL